MVISVLSKGMINVVIGSTHALADSFKKPHQFMNMDFVHVGEVTVSNVSGVIL